MRGVAMILAKFYPEMGGAEHQARLLSRRLVRSGVPVTVLTRNYHGGSSREIIDGIEILRSPTLGSFRPVNSLIYILFCWMVLLIRCRRYSLLHCHQMYSPLTIGAIAGLVLRKPVLVKVTASNEYGEVKALRSLPFFSFRLKLLRLVDRFLVVNPTILAELETLGISESRAEWIPNGVEFPESIPADMRLASRSQLAIANDAPVLLYTGRLSEEKGLFELLRAFSAIVPEFPNALLLLVGEGGAQRNVERDLRAWVAKNGLDSRVRFLGKQPSTDVYLHASDLFVLMSRSEGMSNALLEAMAFGKACVVSDVPGNRTVLGDPENGVYVSYGDADTLALVLTDLCRNAERRELLGKRARERALAEFSMEQVERRIRAVYDEVLGKTQKRVLRIVSRLNIGGPAQHVVYLTRDLSRHDQSTDRTFDTRLVSGVEDPSEQNFLELARAFRVPVTRISSMRRSLHPVLDLLAFLTLLGLIWRYRPQIVHTHTAKAGALGRLAAWLLRVPVRVHTFHGHVLAGYFPRWKEAAFALTERWLGRRSTVVVTLTEKLRSEIEGFRIRPQRGIRIIPLGLDLDRFLGAKRTGVFRGSLGVGESVCLLGIVGRLVPIKRHDLLLAAVARLSPSVHVAIVGGGQEEENLRGQAKSLGIQERVHFCGFRRDLDSVYPDLDLVVLTSDNEGMPVCLIEAMACGLPLVATAVGGVEDLLAGYSSCRICQPNQVDSIVSAVQDMLPDLPTLRKKAQADRAGIVQRFRTQRLAADMRALYEEMLKVP